MWIKYNLDRSTTHRKFDPIWVMDVKSIPGI